MFKSVAALILITLVIIGCGPKEKVDVKELSSAIFPNQPMSEKVMDVYEYPEGSRDSMRKHSEIHMQARREFLSDALTREFSPEELRELNTIYSSELVTRLQHILMSDECLIGTLELAKPKLKILEQNQNMEPIPTTPVK